MREVRARNPRRPVLSRRPFIRPACSLAPRVDLFAKFSRALTTCGSCEGLPILAGQGGAPHAGGRWTQTMARPSVSMRCLMTMGAHGLRCRMACGRCRRWRDARVLMLSGRSRGKLARPRGRARGCSHRRAYDLPQVKLDGPRLRARRSQMLSSSGAPQRVRLISSSAGGRDRQAFAACVCEWLHG